MLAFVDATLDMYTSIEAKVVEKWFRDGGYKVPYNDKPPIAEMKKCLDSQKVHELTMHILAKVDK